MSNPTAPSPAVTHSSASACPIWPEVTDPDGMLDQAQEDTFPASAPVSSNRCN